MSKRKSMTRKHAKELEQKFQAFSEAVDELKFHYEAGAYSPCYK